MTHRTYYQTRAGKIIASSRSDGDPHTDTKVIFRKGDMNVSDPDWRERIQAHAQAKGVTARFQTGRWEDAYSTPSGWSSPTKRKVAEFSY